MSSSTEAIDVQKLCHAMLTCDGRAIHQRRRQQLEHGLDPHIDAVHSIFRWLILAFFLTPGCKSCRDSFSFARQER